MAIKRSKAKKPKMKKVMGKKQNAGRQVQKVGKSSAKKRASRGSNGSSRGQPPLLFISYSHVDEECRKRLRIHLKPLERAQVLRVFDDTQLHRDTGWREQLMKQLRAAKLVILLVSPDFLASDFCFVEEWPIAKKRWERGQATVTFALVEHCQWKETDIGTLQGVPSHGQLLPNDKRGASDFWDKIVSILRHDAVKS